MQIENILEILYGERKNYKGITLMKELLISDEKFREIIIEGIIINVCFIIFFNLPPWSSFINIYNPFFH